MRHERAIAASDAHDERMAVSGLARAARDDALRAAASEFCREMSDRAASEFLRTRLLRYRSGSFRRDYLCDSPPDRLKGRLEVHLWAALMARPVVPSSRTIRRVLSP